MAYTSSSPSVPVLASQSWKYDVFLSFRGEDTRKTFVDHLYKALDQNGINTYKDDVTLPRGETIDTSLETAIKESQISLIIFSVNYANSTWCLNELKHIMKCRDERNQTVLPIFYDVEPWEVRNQKGTYEEAFDKHEHENKAKVEGWREALVEASNLSGWETKLIANGNEAEGIDQIVGEILQRLNLETSGANEDLVGMTNRLQSLKSELQIESGGVLMVGLWGVGGGGKTTLASSIYYAISSMYDGCYFVENIREQSSKIDLKKLQKKVLSGILKQKQVQEVSGVEEGRCMLKARLRHLKVLLVLDDVDELDQLKALVGSRDWFGEGSRILITTRNEHLLKAHRVDEIHPIRLLNNDEAVTLFCKHAHRDRTPMEDFEQLSEEVVSYAGGLPLALTVLGSFLCDKNISQWRSSLARLKEIPDKNIIGILRISFDGLEEDQKGLFLDIACFFRGMKKDDAMEKLHACGFHPVVGVEVLRQKALIVFTEDGKFDMHDLMQEMGHYIVREEHPRNPEYHSRVWNREDVCRILAMDATTKLDNIEAIDLEDVSYEESQRFLQVAGNMKKLRFLEFSSDDEQRDKIILPLPENFPPWEIRCLIIRGGIYLQKQLWDGKKCLPNLRHMELKGLHNLNKIPDLSGLANLETFKLYRCPRLEEIHPSIGRLESLVFLSIRDCDSLQKFPSITRIKKLVTLGFNFCPKLGIMSEEEMEKLGDVVDLGNTTTSGEQQVAAASSSSSSCMQQVVTNFFLNCYQLFLKLLAHIWIWDCPHLRKFPSITRIKKLETLQFHRCYDHGMMSEEEEMEKLGDVVDLGNTTTSGEQQVAAASSCSSSMNRRRLRFSHSSLRKLDLSWCKLGNEEIGSDVWELPNLEQLDLSHNPLISRLDFSILRLPRLKLLNVSRCKGLVDMSGLPSTIAVVMADGCRSLESFGDISNCKRLWKVALGGKNKLDQHRRDTLIESIQENTREDHFMSVALQHPLPTRVMNRLHRGKTFRLPPFPDNWHNDFCGFLLCIVTDMEMPIININIMMKQEDPPPYDVSQQQEFDDEATVEPPATSIVYGEYMTTCVGYVSFGSLRHTNLFTSSYNRIIYTIEDFNPKDKTAYLGLLLNPRERKGDEVATTSTDSSEFWDDNTFKIQQLHDSIRVSWRPYFQPSPARA